jgi:hypothetical protein
VAVVVAGEDAERALDVTLVHDQEPVETLGADGADKTLGDRVRLRRSQRRLDDLDAFAGEDGVEVTGGHCPPLTRRVHKLGRADLQGKSSGPRGAAKLKADAPVVAMHAPARPEAEPTADGQVG